MPWLFLSTCETSAWPLPDHDAFGLPHCSQILVLVNPLQHLWKQFSPESLIPCVGGEEPKICVSHKLAGDGVATGPRMRSTGLQYSSTAPVSTRLCWAWWQVSSPRSLSLTGGVQQVLWGPDKASSLEQACSEIEPVQATPKRQRRHLHRTYESAWTVTPGHIPGVSGAVSPKAG